MSGKKKARDRRKKDDSRANAVTTSSAVAGGGASFSASNTASMFMPGTLQVNSSSDHQSSLQFDPVDAIRIVRRRDADFKSGTTKDLESAPFGQVGFTFVKSFPGHGDFTGMVGEIRLGAEHDKDRRCFYTDGDMEDLSLKELQAIVRAREKKEKKEQKKRARVSDVGPKISKKKRTQSSKTTKRRHSAPALPNSVPTKAANPPKREKLHSKSPKVTTTTKSDKKEKGLKRVKAVLAETKPSEHSASALHTSRNIEVERGDRPSSPNSWLKSSLELQPSAYEAHVQPEGGGITFQTAMQTDIPSIDDIVQANHDNRLNDLVLDREAFDINDLDDWVKPEVSGLKLPDDSFQDEQAETISSGVHMKKRAATTHSGEPTKKPATAKQFDVPSKTATTNRQPDVPTKKMLKGAEQSGVSHKNPPSTRVQPDVSTKKSGQPDTDTMKTRTHRRPNVSTKKPGRTEQSGTSNKKQSSESDVSTKKTPQSHTPSKPAATATKSDKPGIKTGTNEQPKVSTKKPGRTEQSGVSNKKQPFKSTATAEQPDASTNMTVIHDQPDISTKESEGCEQSELTTKKPTQPESTAVKQTATTRQSDVPSATVATALQPNSSLPKPVAYGLPDPSTKTGVAPKSAATARQPDTHAVEPVTHGQSDVSTKKQKETEKSGVSGKKEASRVQSDISTKKVVGTEQTGLLDRKQSHVTTKKLEDIGQSDTSLKKEVQSKCFAAKQTGSGQSDIPTMKAAAISEVPKWLEERTQHDLHKKNLVEAEGSRQSHTPVMNPQQRRSLASKQAVSRQSDASRKKPKRARGSDDATKNTAAIGQVDVSKKKSVTFGKSDTTAAKPTISRPDVSTKKVVAPGQADVSEEREVGSRPDVSTKKTVTVGQADTTVVKPTNSRPDVSEKREAESRPDMSTKKAVTSDQLQTNVVKPTISRPDVFEKKETENRPGLFSKKNPTTSAHISSKRPAASKENDAGKKHFSGKSSSPTVTPATSKLDASTKSIVIGQARVPSNEEEGSRVSHASTRKQMASKQTDVSTMELAVPVQCHIPTMKTATNRQIVVSPMNLQGNLQLDVPLKNQVATSKSAIASISVIKQPRTSAIAQSASRQPDVPAMTSIATRQSDLPSRELSNVLPERSAVTERYDMPGEKQPPSRSPDVSAKKPLAINQLDITTIKPATSGLSRVVTMTPSVSSHSDLPPKKQSTADICEMKQALDRQNDVHAKKLADSAHSDIPMKDQASGSHLAVPNLSLGISAEKEVPRNDARSQLDVLTKKSKTSNQSEEPTMKQVGFAQSCLPSKKQSRTDETDMHAMSEGIQKRRATEMDVPQSDAKKVDQTKRKKQRSLSETVVRKTESSTTTISRQNAAQNLCSTIESTLTKNVALDSSAKPEILLKLPEKISDQGSKTKSSPSFLHRLLSVLDTAQIKRSMQSSKNVKLKFQRQLLRNKDVVSRKKNRHHANIEQGTVKGREEGSTKDTNAFDGAVEVGADDACLTSEQVEMKANEEKKLRAKQFNTEATRVGQEIRFRAVEENEANKNGLVPKRKEQVIDGAQFTTEAKTKLLTEGTGSATDKDGRSRMDFQEKRVIITNDLDKRVPNVQESMNKTEEIGPTSNRKSIAHVANDSITTSDILNNQPTCSEEKKDSLSNVHQVRGDTTQTNIEAISLTSKSSAIGKGSLSEKKRIQNDEMGTLVEAADMIMDRVGKMGIDERNLMIKNLVEGKKDQVSDIIMELGKSQLTSPMEDTMVEKNKDQQLNSNSSPEHDRKISSDEKSEEFNVGDLFSDSSSSHSTYAKLGPAENESDSSELFSDSSTSTKNVAVKSLSQRPSLDRADYKSPEPSLSASSKSGAKLRRSKRSSRKRFGQVTTSTLEGRSLDISDDDFSYSTTSSSHRLKDSSDPIDCNEERYDSSSPGAGYAPNVRGTKAQKVDVFASVSNFIPQDNAAEATLRGQSKKARKEPGDELDLHNLASMLGASTNSGMKQASGQPGSFRSSTNKNRGFQNSQSGSSLGLSDGKVSIDIGSHHILKPVQNTVLLPLSSFNKGKRCSLKVFHKEDKRRIVGEVIMEHDFGWIEAVIDGDLQKARVGSFVVVPSDCKIGQHIDCDIPLPGSKQAAKRKARYNDEKCLAPKSSNREHLPCTDRVDFTLGTFFYWNCASCDKVNAYDKDQCQSCDANKSPECSSSALLDIAQKAVESSTSMESCIESIPFVHRKAIAKPILCHLLQKKGIKEEDSQLLFKMKPGDLDSYFYWNCNVCTMSNSYKKSSCICHQKRNQGCEFSALLKIAYEACRNAMSEKEALCNVSPIHQNAIPEMVLNQLVTCTAVVGKDKRRCLRQRLPGLDYCAVHNESTLQSRNGTQNKSESSVGMVSEDASQNDPQTSGSRYQGLNVLKTDVSKFLAQKVSPNQKNTNNWTIQCVEDGVLCGYQAPFPLGLHVRKYFVGYGFHDGFIKSIDREMVSVPSDTDQTSTSTPVLKYRVTYNDGDEEDLLHHEIKSLRQLYDLSSVESVEPVNKQLVPGTVYETWKGMIEIINTEIKHDGTLAVKFFKMGQGWSTIRVDIRTLQLSIIRKCETADGESKSKATDSEEKTKSLLSFLSGAERSASRAPVLEWPLSQKSELSGIAGKDDDNEEVKLIPAHGLCLRVESEDLSDNEDQSVLDVRNDDKSSIPCCIIGEKEVAKSEANNLAWDPAGAHNYVMWDPFHEVRCEVCNSEHNDHQMLICDKCEKGYHMYCLRPVMVNIPATDWLCPVCSNGSLKVANFEEVMTEYTQKSGEVASFLHLPFGNLTDFHTIHRDALQAFTNKFPGMAASKSKVSVQVGELSFSRHSDNNTWRLPMPLTDPQMYSHSLTTMVAAMKHCGMASYSETLTYNAENEVNESMNDASLEEGVIEPCSLKCLEVFNRYQENLRKGIFAPVEIVYDENIGFKVKALTTIPRHTIITEYIGDVITVEKSEQRSSDSMMMILDTGNPKTSLIIDPTKNGNIARFFSGINNLNASSKRKENLRTRRFIHDGKCKVLMFTSKKVEAGDELHYDYNAGNEGKSVEHWTKKGYYDTSNFQ